MSFFKSFQKSLPSVSSIVDSLSNAVDGITSVVEEVGSSVADSVSEQVTSMIQGLRTEEDETPVSSEQNSSWHKDQPGSQTQLDCEKNAASNVDPEVDSSTSRRKERKQKHCYSSSEYFSNTDSYRESNSTVQHNELEDISYGASPDIRRTKKGRLQHSKQNINEDDQCNQGVNGCSVSNVYHGGEKETGGNSKTMSHKVSENDEFGSKVKSPIQIHEVAHKGKQNSHVNTKTVHESDAPCTSDDHSNSHNTMKPRKVESKNRTKSNRHDVTSQDVRNHKYSQEENTPDDLKQRRRKNKERSLHKSKDRSLNRTRELDKSKKLKGRDLHGSSSESEDEVLGKYQEAASRVHPNRTDKQHNYTWETRQKYSPLSAEYDGYSSEVSADEANCIQRMRRTPPLDELQPPPYQDDGGSPRLSCTPSEIGDSKCEFSQCSNSPRYSYNKCPSEGSTGHEMESFKNTGYEEDVPSDSTAVLSPEDMSARGSSSQLPKSFDPEPVAKYGTLDVTFDYDSQEQKLLVTVTAVTDLPTHNRTGNSNSWQVHLVLLPMKKQRAKTGIQKGPCPVFTETLKFNHIESEMIANYAVRFRLYLVRRMKKERIVGEKVFYLTKLNLQGKMSVPVVLESSYSLSGCDSQMSMSEMSCTESTSSCQSLVHGSAPEILIGLLYNATTGRLSAEVIKGSHFKNLSANRPPNTYVKLTLVNSMGQEMSKCKTSTRRGQPNPLYKETFIFQVALFQLSDVTLLLSVYNKRSLKRRELIGWISLGLNSSGDEQLNHWTEMKESKGQQICRWHTLLES
ncbi:hypothetical protein GDO86_019918 [Hymenochirus boettgeri]|uniref:C2 domain-containing protein n=1 Tax=Hymenochirus boettgeri TaxID=247094 RepID=A0A8T2IIH7_9PIPI|nr:hypothetical protein GDO86_019918 [Hymenochirus boettgeri]